MGLAAIALGSNLGDRLSALNSAIASLRTAGRVIAVSRFWDTAAVGVVDQPRFLNAALLLETSQTPVQLLRTLLGIERVHGRDRARSVPKGPRILDLDLLLYDDVVMNTPELTLPHPEMHRRRFVLKPLAEIAPLLRHPVLDMTVASLSESVHTFEME